MTENKNNKGTKNNLIKICMRQETVEGMTISIIYIDTMHQDNLLLHANIRIIIENIEHQI